MMVARTVRLSNAKHSLTSMGDEFLLLSESTGYILYVKRTPQYTTQKTNSKQSLQGLQNAVMQITRTRK